MDPFTALICVRLLLWVVDIMCVNMFMTSYGWEIRHIYFTEALSFDVPITETISVSTLGTF